MSNDLDYEAIRQRAEKKVRKRAEFLMHLGIYVVVNLLLWIGAFVLGSMIGSLTIPLGIALLSTLGWGVGVVIHGIVTYVETSAIDSIREREIQREIRMEMARRGIDDEDLFEKPKRDRIARLSDDGELIYDEEPARGKSSGRKN